MNEAEVLGAVADSLAGVRAEDPAGLRAMIAAGGLEDLDLTSLEAVAILVELQPRTGVDPGNREVLTGCGQVHTVRDLVQVIMARQGA